MANFGSSSCQQLGQFPISSGRLPKSRKVRGARGEPVHCERVQGRSEETPATIKRQPSPNSLQLAAMDLAAPAAPATPEPPAPHPVKRRIRKKCPHDKPREQCRECGGSSYCKHDKRRAQCKECGGSSFCKHGKQRNYCRECGGSSYCKHRKRRYQCSECGGSSYCKHDKRRAMCKECGGSSLCKHGKQRN